MSFAADKIAGPAADSKVDEIANQAAERFVDSYYGALNSARHAIAGYYVPESKLPDGTSFPVILLNGSDVSDGGNVQRIFQHRYQTSSFEIDVVDCHVLNPQYPPAQAGTISKPDAHSISLLVVVNGIFKVGSGREAVEQDFSDTLILVPNPKVAPSNRPGGGRFRKDYLIQSQTFRTVG